MQLCVDTLIFMALTAKKWYTESMLHMIFLARMNKWLSLLLAEGLYSSMGTNSCLAYLYVNVIIFQILT